jgi:cell division protein FtsB
MIEQIFDRHCRRQKILILLLISKFVTTQVLQKELAERIENVCKKKIYIFASVEEMISIRRSEYEQFLSQQEELKELRDLVRQLREEIELLKNGRNSKTSSTAPSQDISRSNVRSLRKSNGERSSGP